MTRDKEDTRWDEFFKFSDADWAAMEEASNERSSDLFAEDNGLPRRRTEDGERFRCGACGHNEYNTHRDASRWNGIIGPGGTSSMPVTGYSCAKCKAPMVSSSIAAEFLQRIAGMPRSFQKEAIDAFIEKHPTITDEAQDRLFSRYDELCASGHSAA